MEQIKYGKARIEYTVTRGKRKKTVAINVASATQVIVLAPDFLSREKIRSIVKKKARWILEKQEYSRNLALLFPEKEFISGERLLLLGRKYRLKIKEVKEKITSEPRVIGRRIVISIHKDLNQKEKKEAIKRLLINWYCSRSELIIPQRVRRYSRLLNIKPREMIIKDQKKRWGSCTKDGVLRFNWRIVMAPISIVDYVVVHELCHMKVKNHSAGFWRLVSLVLPDYQERRDCLKKHSPLFKL